jgi:hypothetical protein
MNAVIEPTLPDFLALAPFSLDSVSKSKLLIPALRELTSHHQRHCQEYASILGMLNQSVEQIIRIEDIPFIPVRLFKEFELLSIDRSQIFKTMTSSGTTGQKFSRIFLDRAAVQAQQKALARLMAELIGKSRLPMLIVDSPSVISNRAQFSARGAGILGFSMFGQELTYALDDAMSLDLPKVTTFLERHQEAPILIFGFTFMIWRHLLQPLAQAGIKLPAEKGILIHGGGWKKLADQAVTNDEFRRQIFRQTGVERIHNYYGMVEQTGSIFVECEAGHLHSSIFSDIIIRDPQDFSPLGTNHEGLIQVISALPHSYPGHSLLTEDTGILMGEDDCTCGRLGKYFVVTGRIAGAELRGCSDVYAANH